MKCSISKCATLIVHREIFEPAEGIPTSMGRITDVETGKGYKYLGLMRTYENIQSKITDETKHIRQRN